MSKKPRYIVIDEFGDNITDYTAAESPTFTSLAACEKAIEDYLKVPEGEDEDDLIRAYGDEYGVTRKDFRIFMEIKSQKASTHQGDIQVNKKPQYIVADIDDYQRFNTYKSALACAKNDIGPDGLDPSEGLAVLKIEAMVSYVRHPKCIKVTEFSE